MHDESRAWAWMDRLSLGRIEMMLWPINDICGTKGLGLTVKFTAVEADFCRKFVSVRVNVYSVLGSVLINSLGTLRGTDKSLP